MEETNKKAPPAALKTHGAIDLDAMKAQMGDVNAETIEMVSMFCSMTEALVARIRKSQAAGNAHDLEEAAHSLKGGARSACCGILGDLAADLQTNAHDPAKTTLLVDAIEKEFARVKTEAAELSKSVAA